MSWNGGWWAGGRWFSVALDKINIKNNWVSFSTTIFMLEFSAEFFNA
jgi:hypothetical protein